MANVAHSTLSGADLHEPKGIGTAVNNTVYVANGSGSGAWLSASSTLAIAGMVADFATPIAPTGWLECDGSAVSRTTFATLFSAITIQQTGTRTNNSPTITGLADTSGMRVGYLVGGTGIIGGTVILSVDSGTQITISVNAVSSGSATVVVSPWAQGDGFSTFNLPDAKTAGRYRRSRTSSIRMGVTQADSFASHTHTGQASGTTDFEAGDHTHTQQGTFQSGGASADHTHSVNGYAPSFSVQAGGSLAGAAGPTSVTTSGVSVDHTHATTISGQTSGRSAAHQHTFTSGVLTTTSTGGTETRPISIVLMTCIKT